MNEKNEHRISDISFDEQSIGVRSPLVERERAIAIYDLIAQNLFHPCPIFPIDSSEKKKHWQGPYKLCLRIVESRLYFKISDETNKQQGEIIISLVPFRRIVRDYFQICESYFDAVKKHSPTTIETIDMARRGIHDEGAVLLLEQLAGKIESDHPTARRLFTLIAMLYLRL